MDLSSLELGGLTALGTLGSVCAILLRSTRENLQSLESMRRDAQDVAEKLRGQLREHEQLVAELRALCAETERRLELCQVQFQALQQERQADQIRLSRSPDRSSIPDDIPASNS